MRGTLWLWLAGTALVCVSLQVSALPYSDTRAIQENSLLSLKRTKPSLSIVNPLDVLRQRIILEMARRQMRENTRQVELNKALLREIGKRSSNFYDGLEEPLDPAYAYYDRKLAYSQRVAPDPERRLAEDELEAMVESLLRSHLTNHQRQVRQGSGVAASRQDRPQDQAHQSQFQPSAPQPGRLFTNNEQPLAGQSNQNEAFQQHGDAQDDDADDGNNEHGHGDEEGNEEVSVQSGDKPESTGNAESDFRPRFVYGMYKNRYAN